MPALHAYKQTEVIHLQLEIQSSNEPQGHSYLQKYCSFSTSPCCGLVHIRPVVPCVTAPSCPRQPSGTRSTLQPQQLKQSRALRSACSTQHSTSCRLQCWMPCRQCGQQAVKAAPMMPLMQLRCGTPPACAAPLLGHLCWGHRTTRTKQHTWQPTAQVGCAPVQLSYSGRSSTKQIAFTWMHGNPHQPLQT